MRREEETDVPEQIDVNIVTNCFLSGMSQSGI